MQQPRCCGYCWLFDESQTVLMTIKGQAETEAKPRVMTRELIGLVVKLAAWS
jgi:hypothetical protein